MPEQDPYGLREEPDDSANPYAAPRADLTPRLPGSSYGESFERLEPFSIDAVMRRAWSVFKERTGIVLALVLGVGAMNGGFSLLQNGLQVGLQAGQVPPLVFGLVSFVVTIAMVIFQFWVGIGQTRALLRVARGQEAKFADVFACGRFFWRFLGASIVVGLLVMLAFLVCAIPAGIAAAAFWQQGEGLGGVGLLTVLVLAATGFVALLAVSVRLGQYAYVLLDRDCGAIDCIQGSIELTRGHAFEIVALQLLSGLLILLGILACFVGVLFTAPLAVMVMASTYALLAGSPGQEGKDKPGSRDFVEL